MRLLPPRAVSRSLFLFAFVFLFALASVGQASLTWTYNAASDVPVTANGYTASGTATLALNFAPTPGTLLMVVNNTGLSFISGTFSNLAQGQAVPLTYNGITYNFVANYYGGSGHDLVLQWAAGRLLAWGYNGYDALGSGSDATSSSVPVAVDSTGVLAGKTVVAAAESFYHSMALCSDGTLAVWGSNPDGELGDGSESGSPLPELVNASAGSALAGKRVVAITAGNSHSLALCADGTVAAWGDDSYGQRGDGGGIFSWLPVAVSTSDGSALAGKTVSAIAAGIFHSLALCSDGTVAAWGNNADGELGNNSTTESDIPVLVSTAAGSALAGKTVVAIAAGVNYSLALCSDGTLAAWGSNGAGQLGNNSTVSSSIPMLVDTSGVLAGKTVVAIAGGSGYSLALCSDGTLAAWGANDWGQLGNNSTTLSLVPVLVDTSADSALAGKTVTAIATTAVTSLALCADGTLTAWGNNYYGNLGNNSTTDSHVPVAVSTVGLATGERWAFVGSSSASYHTLAFATAPPWPVESTLAASAITPTSATLNGMVIPGNYTASVSFDYGTTTSYGTNVAGAPSPVSGSGTTAVSAAITNLSPGVTYHFRVDVASSYGGSSGSDVTFTTASAVPATWNAATDVPVTSNGFTASSGTVNLSLNFAPTPGTTLTVVKNTGLGFINGTFSNLAQGQAVALIYNGTTYNFVANYYGGSGNDLVLQWANVRPLAWGDNNLGELGNNSTTNSSVPVPVVASGVLAGKTILAVVPGQYHSLALCSDGTVAAWGSNSNGQLGNNSTTNSNVPVLVSASAGSALAGKTVIAVAAGGYHSLALCSDGTVAAWGANVSGGLGNNSTADSSAPVAVNTSGVLAGKTVVAIAAGALHSLALCSDGTAVAWGDNGIGELGNNSTTNSSVPVLVNTAGVLAGKAVVAIVSGVLHSGVLCSDGTVAAWGSNSRGQLGNNSTTNSNVPVLVNTAGVLAGKTVVAVAAGDSHSAVLCSDGTVATWGNNADGELGNNSNTSSSVPVLVNTAGVLAGKTVVTIEAGVYRSLAACSDGTVVDWGHNAFGELGNNSTTSSNVPVLVSTATLAAGEQLMLATTAGVAFHTLALAAEPPPAAITLAATSVTGNSAILNGTINAYNYSTAVSFDYGSSVSYGTNVAGTPTPVTGASATAVSTTLTGLLPGTTHHFRVNGVNSVGASSGSDLTFTTLNNITATFNAATDVPLTVPDFTATGGTLTLR